ncbi:efflux RND transporter periplasmic adaptor subunit [Parahaliea mediterranea]|uniref:Biotin/lipoyl-binding protein n=1 Tax=Parahaliea mediterranea TaxID=651086 RepID=A0A939DHQ5_9GAMM|nr:HlyD family efflux transporter periplasmic adaptor subunit [Parahaliea mediterranea]MBN7798469.1 biotin/lipoyl-binding protein [Parahaliea mediterranea]
MTSLSPRRWLGAPWRLLRRVSRKNRILAGILGVTALAAGTLMATAPHPEPPDVEEKAWPVSAIAVQPAALAPELRLFGRVESPHHASLSSAIAAQVTAVHVREGQPVGAGQLLVSLDPAEERLRLRQAEANLADARARLATVKTEHLTHQRVLAHMQELFELTSAKAERLKNLNQRQLIATEQMENTLQDVARQGIELARQQALVEQYPQRLASAESAVDNAMAAQDNQRLNLRRTEIRAPFDGLISGLRASPGDRVGTGSELLSLYDTAALQVRAALPSGSLDSLKPALQRGLAVTAQVPGANLTLRLAELAAAVAPGRSGVDGLFRMPAGAAGLELGRAVELRLSLPAVDNVVALPPQSLYNNGRVFVIENNRLRGVEVTPLGQRTNASGELEVLVSAASLPRQARVLASSLPKATSGLLVRDVAAEVAGAPPEAAPEPSPDSPPATPQPG